MQDISILQQKTKVVILLFGTLADINKEIAFAFASNFSSLCSHMLCFCLCVLAKGRKIASKSKCYLFINMSQRLCFLLLFFIENQFFSMNNFYYSLIFAFQMFWMKFSTFRNY
jgi:hypothetical protein